MSNGGKTTLILGEVLIDLFSGPVDRATRGMRSFPFEGVPGGAPCNVAVNLAVRGLPVSLVTGFADDPLGRELREMLKERGIDLAHAPVFPQSRTPTATVISLPGGDRTFRLYLQGSCLEKLTPELLTDGMLEGADWVHFGSVIMAFRGPNELTHALTAKAREQGLITSYDVNVRADLWSESDVDPSTMVEILQYVDVLKVSDEDLGWMAERFGDAFGRPDALIEKGPALVALTRGADGAVLFSREARVEIEAPKVSVVDTTGAGDAFMAGLIYSLKQHEVRSRENLKAVSTAVLQAVGQYASEAAGQILVRRGALPPV